MSQTESLTELLNSKWNQAVTWQEFVAASKENVEQMNQGFESTPIHADVESAVAGLGAPVRLLVVCEDWCAESAASIPGLARLAGTSDRLELRILGRDDNKDLMEHFLTDGSVQIPKVIVASAAMDKYADWGPRPAACHAIITENMGKMSMEEIYPLVRKWYADDQGQTAMRDVTDKIAEIAG